jgi:hypothetical protein
LAGIDIKIMKLLHHSESELNDEINLKAYHHSALLSTRFQHFEGVG